MLKVGNMMLFVIVCVDKNVKEGVDFMFLMVEY